MLAPAQMLTDLSIDGFLAFGAAYPLCLWANPRARVDGGFYRFNLGVACFVLSLGVLALLLAPPAAAAAQVPRVATIGGVVWLAMLLAVTWAGWRRERPSLLLVSAPSALGVAVVAALVAGRTAALGGGAAVMATATTLAGAAALGMALYTMILGHWYLNVERLPIAHLSAAVWAYAVILALRVVWNVVAVSALAVDYQGLPLPVWRFIATLDGFLLAVGIFFGTLLPLALVVMVQRTLAAKSTQSATGLLYVVVVAAIIGDFSYRFYQLRYEVFL